MIAATNKNLGDAVRNRQFREDLFYRLNVIQIAIPPLRDHKEDILPLAAYFLRMYNRKFQRSIEGLSSEAAAALTAHHWPGNVRELRNAIERAMVLEDSEELQPSSLAIEGEGLDPSTGLQARGQPPIETGALSLEEVEKSMLVRALEEAGEPPRL